MTEQPTAAQVAAAKLKVAIAVRRGRPVDPWVKRLAAEEPVPARPRTERAWPFRLVVHWPPDVDSALVMQRHAQLREALRRHGARSAGEALVTKGRGLRVVTQSIEVDPGGGGVGPAAIVEALAYPLEEWLRGQPEGVSVYVLDHDGLVIRSDTSPVAAGEPSGGAIDLPTAENT